MKFALATFAAALLIALTPGSADAAAASSVRLCHEQKIKMTVNGTVIYRSPGKCWPGRTATSTGYAVATRLW